MMNQIQNRLKFYLLYSVAIGITLNSVSCGCNNFFGNPLFELIASPDIKGKEVAVIKLKHNSGKEKKQSKYGEVILHFHNYFSFRKSDGNPLEHIIRLSDFLGKSHDEVMPDEIELKVRASNDTLASDIDQTLELFVSEYGTRSLYVNKPVVTWKQDKAVFEISVNYINSNSIVNNDLPVELTITVEKKSGTVTDNAIELRFEGYSSFQYSKSSTGPWQMVPYIQDVAIKAVEINECPNKKFIDETLYFRFNNNLLSIKGSETLKVSIVNVRNSSIVYAPSIDLLTYHNP